MRFADTVRWWQCESKDILSTIRSLRGTGYSEKELKIAHYELLAHACMRYAKILSEE